MYIISVDKYNAKLKTCGDEKGCCPDDNLQ